MAREGPDPFAGYVSQMTTTRRVWVALGTVYVVWGSTYLGIKVAIETIPPFVMAGTRFLIAGGVLYAAVIRRGDATCDPIGRAQWLSATLIGGLLLGANGVLSWVELRVPTGAAALIIASVPIWMAIIAGLLGQERVGVRTVAGLVVGLGGIALLVRSVESAGGRASTPVILLLVLVAISWAAGSVLSRRVKLPKRPLVATGMEMICGGAVLAIAGIVSGEFGRLHPSQISGASIAGLVYLIVVGSWVGFSTYVWLLRSAPPSLVSTYAYVNPVVAVFLGWVFLGESVTGLTILAAALIVGAVALIVLAQAGRPAAVGTTVPTPPEFT